MAQTVPAHLHRKSDASICELDKKFNRGLIFILHYRVNIYGTFAGILYRIVKQMIKNRDDLFPIPRKKKFRLFA